MKKQISVIVPTLNSATTLDWTLLSLRNQVDCCLKIIVVDSGSTDATVDICKRWDVESVYEPPGNMYRALNTGFQLCDTDWVSYINSDDYIFSNSYARLLEIGNSFIADVVYGHSDYIDRFGRFLFAYRPAPPSWLGHLFRKGLMGFAQPSAVFRREVFKSLGGFNENFRSISDFDFFWRALKSGYTFKLLPAPTVSVFRLHENQLSHRESELTNKEVKTLLATSTKTLNLMPSFFKALWRIRNADQYCLKFLRTRSVRGW